MTEAIDAHLEAFAKNLAKLAREVDSMKLDIAHIQELVRQVETLIKKRAIDAKDQAI
jgi:hypothetical protein